VTVEPGQPLGGGLAASFLEQALDDDAVRCLHVASPFSCEGSLVFSIVHVLAI
jgi:hypothetical protein